jgi:hypothetical protein
MPLWSLLEFPERSVPCADDDSVVQKGECETVTWCESNPSHTGAEDSE